MSPLKTRWIYRRAKCSFSHDLHSEHNARLLRTHGLEDLDKKEICVLLLQNDMDLLPSVRFFFFCHIVRRQHIDVDVILSLKIHFHYNFVSDHYQ